MKKNLSLLCFFLSWNVVFAQSTTSPYRLSWAADAPVLGIGLAFPIVNHYLWQPTIAPLTEAQILSLNRSAIPSFDISATMHASQTARTASDIGLMASIALPASLFLDPAIRRDYQTVGVLYAETLLMNYLVTETTKQLVTRPRPLVYNPALGLSEKMEQDARFSFFSGHTSTAAAASFFAAKVYSDYHAGSPEIPYIWASAALVPAAVGFLRYEGGKHFPTDILVGYLVGAAVGVLVPELHKIKIK